MSTLLKFPSIDQFRHVIRDVQLKTRYAGKDENDNAIYDTSKPLPTITFTGTCKIHGTNDAICYELNKPAEYWTQSRERILDPIGDNAGFHMYTVRNHEYFIDVLTKLNDKVTDVFGDRYQFVSIYGEWCGNGIQRGVAISQLPKMFVIFGVSVSNKTEDGELQRKWLPTTILDDIIGTDTPNLYLIHNFETYSVDIDFEHPEIAQNEITKLVEKVEAECPVGKHFGVSGIGEGIVFSAEYNGTTYRFKAKGEKYSSSKVKTIAAVDVERLNSIKELVQTVVTENRLKQGFDLLSETQALTERDTGKFIKWVIDDVVKEELDTIAENGFTVKDVSSEISNVARKWFFAQL